jgi:hypothetical protein
MLVRFAQSIIVAVPLALFGWLVNQEIVPSGTFAVRHVTGEPSPFLDELLPEARVDEHGVITDEPVFFFAHPHRSFDTVEAEVRFKNDGVPIVELGALGNAEAQAYDLKPLQNLIVDRLDWHRSEQGGLVLLQRHPVYADMDAFLADPPPVSEMATYHASPPKPFVLPGYAPSPETRAVDVSLRGFHEFKTYVKDETLTFDFAYTDMNRDDGADPVSVVVLNAAGEPVADARAPDDGNLEGNSPAATLRHVALSVPGLPEGVYKISMQGGRDIFWRTISTTQQKMVFLNNVYLGDEVGYRDEPRAVTFWTEAKRVSFATRHAEGLQTVVFGFSSLAHVIDEPYRRFAFDVEEPGVLPVHTEAGDLEVATDGHVAFSSEMYFNPDPVRLAYDTDLDRLGVNYVLAAYEPPKRDGDWYVARAAFDAKDIVLKDGAWKFAVSAPGVKELETSLTVGRIDMIWTREPFIDYVRSRLGLGEERL